MIWIRRRDISKVAVSYNEGNTLSWYSMNQLKLRPHQHNGRMWQSTVCTLYRSGALVPTANPDTAFLFSPGRYLCALHIFPFVAVPLCVPPNLAAQPPSCALHAMSGYCRPEFGPERGSPNRRREPRRAEVQESPSRWRTRCLNRHETA